MKTSILLALATGITLSTIGGAAAQETRTVQVRFESGQDSAVITGRVTGREIVLYKLNARDGQFLSVSLRPDNLSANYNIYIPGRGPGDEALFVSASGGHEYTGQLYKTGDHTISVFLIPAAARRDEVANYDIVFRITEQPAGPLPAEAPPAVGAAPSSSSGDSPWNRVTMKSRDHAPLLARMEPLSPDQAKRPVALALLVLDPDLLGLVTGVSTNYDSMENPAEVDVTVTEGGILDDDLHGVRHVLSLARNSNDQWRIVAYAHGELRRAHFQ